MEYSNICAHHCNIVSFSFAKKIERPKVKLFLLKGVKSLYWSVHRALRLCLWCLQAFRVNKKCLFLFLFLLFLSCKLITWFTIINSIATSVILSMCWKLTLLIACAFLKEEMVGCTFHIIVFCKYMNCWPEYKTTNIFWCKNGMMRSSWIKKSTLKTGRLFFFMKFDRKSQHICDSKI